MYEEIENYKLRKLIYSIIFDFNNNDYTNKPYMFDLVVLDSLKILIKYHAGKGDFTQDVVNNINKYLIQARNFNDKDREERIDLINQIIRIMNTGYYDELSMFYRRQLVIRRNDTKYMYKIPYEEIHAEINSVHESICNDLFVLTTHTDEVTDGEFINKYLPMLTQSKYYYESLNTILIENPIVFKNLTFYNRMICVMNSRSAIYPKNKEIKKENKRIVKMIRNL